MKVKYPSPALSYQKVKLCVFCSQFFEESKSAKNKTMTGSKKLSKTTGNSTTGSLEKSSNSAMSSTAQPNL